jgi:DNA end-binding protein Ku
MLMKEPALIAMIEAKRNGKKPAPELKTNVVNLADILRKSLAQEGRKASTKATSTAAKRKRA